MILRALTSTSTDDSEINWVMIRAVLASVADVAIVPLQDVLGLGSSARMNLPGHSQRKLEMALSSGRIERRVERETSIPGRALRPVGRRLTTAKGPDFKFIHVAFDQRRVQPGPGAQPPASIRITDLALDAQ